MISEYGYCTLPVVPMRATASHRAEMVSQLLFGEGYRVLHAEGEWIEIETDADRYRGFIAANQHEDFSAADCEAVQKASQRIAQHCLHVYDEKRGCRMTLPPASILRLTPEGNIRMGGFLFRPEEEMKTPDLNGVLRAYEGTPYLWGGRTPWGIDCSGFTQAVFRTQGIFLPRDASQQAQLGTAAGLSGAGYGDLAFFHNENGRITHVGLVLPGGRILHCSGRVRNDRLDAQGIFCESSGKYSHALHGIRHIADPDTDNKTEK